MVREVLAFLLETNDEVNSLETMERKIKEFERYANIEILEFLKIGIVIRQAEEGPMRTHLIMNSHRLATFQDIKTEVTKRQASPECSESEIGRRNGPGAASWGDVRLAALLLLPFHCLLRTGEAGGFNCLSAATLAWSRFRGPKVAPRTVRKRSSPLTTRWSMASSSTFAEVWNPRIWKSLPAPLVYAPSSQRQRTSFRSTTWTCGRTVFAEAVPRTITSCTQICLQQSSEAGGAICALPASTSTVASPRKRKFTRILCRLSYSLCCPSSPPRDGIPRLGNVGKTHVFDVLAVSFVRGSARLWPDECCVIHCMPGSG